MHLAPWLAFVIALFGASLCMVALNHVASRRWRKSWNSHWTERARLLYPARIGVAVNIIFLGACAVTFGSRYSTTHPFALILFGLAGLFGAALGCFPLDRQIFPEIKVGEWFTQLAQGWGSRLLLFGPFLVVAALMPREWNWQVAVIGILFAAWHLWFGSVGYFQVLIWLRLLKPAGPDTLRLLEQCFVSTGVRPRAVWQMKTPLVAAYAVPTRHELLFSSSFLQELSPKEINAVCYHELAHLTEDRLTTARRMLGLLMFYPFIFIRPCLETGGVAGFIPIYIAFGAVLMLNNRLAKKMEYRADNEAVLHQTDEGTYARALETVYRLNLVPAVMPSRGQVHPHLYDRMVSAGVTPDFPRPKAPSAMSMTIIIPIVIGVWLFLSRI